MASLSVKHGILAVLDRRSMHGYDLRRELEDELGPAWAVNYGQIYTTLERLVRDGFVVQSETVTSGEAPERKLYTVTPAGRAALRQWFLTPVQGVENGRDELYAKIVLGLTGGVDVEEVIQIQRKGQLRRIGLLTELKEEHDPELELIAVLDLDMAIMKTEAVIRWLDSAEAKIARSTAGGAAGIRDEVGGDGQRSRPERVAKPSTKEPAR